MGRSPSWLVVGGLAAALVLPLAVSAARFVTAEAALRRGVSKLEPGDRSVTVSIVDSTGQGHYGTLDAGVAAVLHDLGGAPIRQVIYREASDTKGGGFVLAGVDGLADFVRIAAGRLPGECRPERCEVVQLGESTSTTFDADVIQPLFGLVVVGSAERTDDLVLSGTFEPNPGSPLLVGDGIEAVESVAALRTHGRTYGWVTPVDPVLVIDIGADAWLGRANLTAGKLAEVHQYFVVALPNDAVREKARRAEARAGRFRFVGVALPVVVFGTTLVGATVRSRGAAGRLRANVTVRQALFRVAIAFALATAAGLAICGMLAARSPLGFGRVMRSALGGA